VLAPRVVDHRTAGGQRENASLSGSGGGHEVILRRPDACAEAPDGVGDLSTVIMKASGG
jgi:hypothetical protein